MEITMLEVTEEEMKSIIAKREREAEEAKIAELAEQLKTIIEEIRSLGGVVWAQGDTRYASVLGDRIYKVSCKNRLVKMHF